MTKPLKANKGEWSELYALVRMLADRALFAADPNLSKIPGKEFSIIKVSRGDLNSDAVVSYDLSAEPGKVVISQNGNYVSTVECDFLSNLSENFLKELKSKKGKSFEMEKGEEARRVLYCETVKASSSNKSDIHVLINDGVASSGVELGFSVKSWIGGAPTLLNASLQTNFSYFTETPVEQNIGNWYNNGRLNKRIELIERDYGRLYFSGLKSDSFKENLRMIDSSLPQLLSELLLAFYKKKGHTLNDLVSYLDQEGVLESKFSLDKASAVYKLKEFLLAAALGMVPSVRWAGKTIAQGGYIVVKPDGSLVCFLRYNLDEFKDYLFYKTKLEKPSTKRHQYGRLVMEDNSGLLRLNLQVRFNKKLFESKV